MFYLLINVQQLVFIEETHFLLNVQYYLGSCQSTVNARLVIPSQKMKTYNVITGILYLANFNEVHSNTHMKQSIEVSIPWG